LPFKFKKKRKTLAPFERREEEENIPWAAPLLAKMQYMGGMVIVV
jgi:hypothetical protein